LTFFLSRQTERLQLPTDRDPFHEWTFPDGTVWTSFYRRGENYLLRFPELADFEVSAHGDVVRCWPVPEVSDGTIDHLYLNQVLPLALSKKENFVFHASAIEADRGALVFMGESGRGKSTLAASFATHGFRFLTDDGLLLEEMEGGYQVLPSHPSLRLWQDSEDALVTAEVPLAPPVQYTSKARLLAGKGLLFCEEARPLHRVYFLGEGSAAEVAFTPVGASQALIELVKHSFLLDIEEQALLAGHFDRLTRLVARPIFYRLDFPRRYEALAQARQAILEHATEENGFV
jgi:hypothetical protein